MGVSGFKSLTKRLDHFNTVELKLVTQVCLENGDLKTSNVKQ